MILHTTEVKPLPEYRLAVRFNNGENGIIDLSAELTGDMFAPLRDLNFSLLPINIQKCAP